jgi:CRP-like cAMP-binding protein
MATQQYEPGDVIFREGDESQEAYCVLSGRIRLTLKSPSGPQALAELGPGQIFGEMGMIEDAPRAATAEAVEPTSLEVVDEALFEQIILQNPDRLRQYLATVFERLRQANTALRLSEMKRTGSAAGATDALTSEVAAERLLGALDTQKSVAGTAGQIPIVHLESRYPADWSDEVIREEIKEFPYKIGREAKIGPDSPFGMNDLFLKDRMPWNVSRNHCAIERRGATVVVKDRGSNVGTIVNGTPIGVRFTKVAAELNPGENELIIGVKSSPHRFTVTVS